MEMEREEGAGMKPLSTIPPSVPHVGEGASPSSLTSGSGTSANGEGDEGHQLMVPGQDGDDDGVGVDVTVEPKEGEGSSNRSRELHPLKNAVILKTMFDLCPPQLLINFRLVCKEWLDLSLEAWHSSATLTFCQYYEGKIKLVVNGGDQDLPLKKFLNYVSKHCLLKPFRRYELVDVVFPGTETKNRKLWKLVKRDATFLGLTGCSFPDVEVFKNMLYNELPNLKQLELHYCRIGHIEEPTSVGVYPENLNLKSLSISQGVYESGYPIPMDWLELFSHFPSLTRLSFGIENPGAFYDEPLEISEYELLRVLEAIQAVRKADPRKLPLKHFDILPYFPTTPHRKQFGQIFRLLQELHLTLPSSLKLYMARGQKENVKKLASQIDAARLRSLHCYRDDGISTFKFPFKVPLENMSKLVMTKVLWENMDFLRLVPNLATLEITDESGHNRSVSAIMLSKTGKEGLADVKLLKLKEFTWGYALTEDDLRHFGNWFPNLTNLATILDDKTFPIVCKQWCDLRSLTVEGAELSDEGVTGLRAGQIVGDLDTMELPPNIRLLQNLTYVHCPKSRNITDASIFNGFLKLPQLSMLILGKGPSEKAKAAVEESGKMNMYLE